MNLEENEGLFPFSFSDLEINPISGTLYISDDKGHRIRIYKKNVITAAEIKVENKDAFVLYPNPSKGEFNIVANESRYQIFNGSRISVQEGYTSKGINNLSLNNPSAGIYYIVLEEGNKKTGMKFIVQ